MGEHDWQCSQSTLAWYCTGVISLGDAAPSDAGTITVAGLSVASAASRWP